MNCVIEIEDTGIGIDPDDIEKIWGRFYKAIVSQNNESIRRIRTWLVDCEKSCHDA